MCFGFIAFFGSIKYVKSMCGVAFVNYFLSEEHTTHPQQSIPHTLSQIEWVNEKERPKCFDAGEEEKKDRWCRKLDWRSRDGSTLENMVSTIQVFQRPFSQNLLFCWWCVYKEKYIFSLDLLELEPFWFFCFHQKWSPQWGTADWN